MYLEIHGTRIEYSGEECGIYSTIFNGYSMSYEIMEPLQIVKLLNSLPIDKAIHAATALRDTADEQTQWKGTHPNVGRPMIRRKPRKTIPLSEVRQNIKNTRDLANILLDALQQSTGKNISSP